MKFPSRFKALPEYAFPRLHALLAGREPGCAPVSMSIGEPRHAFPEFIPEILTREAVGYSKYPPIDGTPGLRDAIAGWLKRRYDLPGGLIDPDACVLPLNGTREGLFMAVIALCPEVKNGARPAVLLPNPFYQCYAAAALAAGAEPIYLPATAQTGFLPDFAATPRDILDRTAIAFLCSPANPQGSVASPGYWDQLLGLAERHDFRVFADECYAEIYRAAPPPGILTTAARVGADLERVVAFHSLSKRSNLAGLRSGFSAAGPKTTAAMKRLRAYAGAPSPLPTCHAAEAAWRDEAHVKASRALYARKFDIADAVLGGMAGYTPAEAGFFLWIGVEDDERAVVDLWTRVGVKALPGSYLSRPVDPRLGGGNPGAGYIRVALVADATEVERGLTALRDTLS